MLPCTDLGVLHPFFHQLTRQAGRKQYVKWDRVEALPQTLGISQDECRRQVESLIDIGLVSRNNGSLVLSARCGCPRVPAATAEQKSSTATSQKTGSGSSVPTPATPVGYSRHQRVRQDLRREDDEKRQEAEAQARGKRPPYHQLPVEEWNGFHLASYFRTQVSETAVRANVALGPEPYNHTALAGSIARWRRDGISSAIIKKMIDLLVLDIHSLKVAGVPAWKVFLGRRQQLYREANRIVKQEERHHSRKRDDDLSYWLGG